MAHIDLATLIPDTIGRVLAPDTLSPSISSISLTISRKSDTKNEKIMYPVKIEKTVYHELYSAFLKAFRLECSNIIIIATTPALKNDTVKFPKISNFFNFIE